MSDATHTPGEWRMSEIEGGFLITMGTALKRPHNCETHHLIEMDFSLYPEDGEQYDEAKANARLMASAPYGLEIAKELLDLARSGGSFVYPPGMLQKLERYVAKATGRTA
ncbi:hypothetical protein HMPREF9946_03103 [Acetobacteraceae bacterium AT-5844]|nr:hypothetical protein HMPREF9946_03103 [Acetobacteraceae bacterium AT-5844]